MPTPFASFAAARLAWQRPTEALTNLRDGFRYAATETVVIDFFFEPGVGEGSMPPRARSDDRNATTIQASKSRTISGYITRWAVVPEDANWLDAGTGWTWNDTGLRPDGLTAGEDELQAALVSIANLPAIDRAEIGTMTLDQLGSSYGPGGVGAVITRTAGEYLMGTFRAR
jgi:hypothetical protein